MASIHPEYLTFGKLVNNRLFRIPEYQRAYSWQSEQRDDLFKDIKKTRQNGGSEHYMATMVTLSKSTIRIRFPKPWMGSNESRH